MQGVRGSLNVKNADIHAKDYADVYVGDNSEQIQAYDRNGPVTTPEVFSMEEIEMQWIFMESRGKSVQIILHTIQIQNGTIATKLIRINTLRLYSSG